MSKLVLSGDTSGSVTLDAPAVSGTTILTLPTSSGTVTVAGVNSNIVSSTSQATTSGTSKDFTSIPSWVKRITVMFSGVSTNGSSFPQVQLGTSGGVVSSGYSSYAGYFTVSNQTTASSATTGFHMHDGAASSTRFGMMTITNITGNTWTSNHTMGDVGGVVVFSGGGSIALSGALDRLRITTVNGTDTFDAGSVNILYE